MALVKADCVFNNDDKFILKLPFSCGGQHRGRKVTMKPAQGFEDILRKVQQMLKNREILGYIPYVILQPRIKENTEAKVRTI